MGFSSPDQAYGPCSSRRPRGEVVGLGYVVEVDGVDTGSRVEEPIIHVSDVG